QRPQAEEVPPRSQAGAGRCRPKPFRLRHARLRLLPHFHGHDSRTSSGIGSPSGSTGTGRPHGSVSVRPPASTGGRGRGSTTPPAGGCWRTASFCWGGTGGKNTPSSLGKRGGGSQS